MEQVNYNLKSEENSKILLENFWNLLEEGVLTDVTLVCSANESIPVHRLILSANSPYFKELLQNHQAHPHPIIILHDVPFSVLRQLVSFMYRGQVNVLESEMEQLLKTAENLQITGLSKSSCISMTTNQPPIIHYSKKARILELNNLHVVGEQVEPLALKTTPPQTTTQKKNSYSAPVTPTNNYYKKYSSSYSSDSPPNSPPPCSNIYPPTSPSPSTSTNIPHQIICKFCGKPFPEVSQLIQHLPIHTGERPFKCEFCGKAFKLRHHMKDHARVHTGERPFRCALCGKTFSRSTILKAHEKTHFAKNN